MNLSRRWKRLARQTVHGALRAVWLREGTVRTAFAGPQRGIRFALRGPMKRRLSAFYRAYEPTVSGWLRDHVKPGMTVYVVGAHVGIHALYIAKLLKGNGQIVAFEGWSENFTYLQQNFALNQHLGVGLQPVAACAAAQSGTVRMAQGSSDGRHHIAEGDGVEVTALALDDFAAQSGRLPDLLLIDVEGAEDAVLQGAAQILAARHPAMVIEHHNRIEPLMQRLAAFGYRPEHHGRHLMMD